MKKLVLASVLAFVATSLTAYGGEEKETRTVPNGWNELAKNFDASLAVPKSYVREKKADTLPPFIAAFAVKESNHSMFAVIADEQSKKDIIGIKVNNGECETEYEVDGGMMPYIALEMYFCDIKQVELTTKAGKVTYKF